MKLEQLQTPALVADRAILNANMRAMMAMLEGKTLRLRPHYKSNKCAAIAHKQMELGAVGITCAKLEEAEDLIDAGVTDVLIANQVVDPLKIRRLAELAGMCRLTVCVDDGENAEALSKAACEAGTTIHVLVEFEIGMERCGVADPDLYVALARKVSTLQNLVYDGIQAYAGHVSHMASDEERRSYTDENAARLRSLIELLKHNGIEVHTLSGGSTGTSRIKAEQGLYTELQAGSYLFMDSTYRALSNLPFRNSLFLLTTVVSKRGALTILDAGVKSLGVDQNEPIFLTMDGDEIKVDNMAVNEEHCKMFSPDHDLSLGDHVLIVPGHCCSTVNLHDRLYLFENGEVVDRLAITARGKSR